MREYGSVHTCFWSHPAMQQLSDQAKLLALYLLTGPHTTMLGCFRQPPGYIAEDLKWDIETVTRCLDELSQKEFITHDVTTGWLIIHNFLIWNPIENPNQGKSIYKLFEKVPENSPIFSILVTHLMAHDKHLSEQFRHRLQILSKQFQNQEQNQNHKQEQEQDKHLKKMLTHENATNKPAINRPISNTLEEIFEFWKTTLGHPHAILDKNRKQTISKAIAMGYNVDQLREAILGCAKTPHNLGHNELNQRYDGLHIIFKNADNIDRFIRNCHNPPILKLPVEYKKHLSTTKPSGVNENFDDKQYYQTPIENIGWLNGK